MKLKNFWLDFIKVKELNGIGHDRMKWYEQNVICLLVQDQKEFFNKGYKDIEEIWPGVRVLK